MTATPRHTADSITDDALDALYAERDRLAAALGTEPQCPAAHAPRPQERPGAVRAVPGMPETPSGPQTGADGFGLRESVKQVLAELRTRLVAQHKGAMSASAASSGDVALIHDGERMGLDVAVAELDALALRLAEGRSSAPDRS